MFFIIGIPHFFALMQCSAQGSVKRDAAKSAVSETNRRIGAIPNYLFCCNKTSVKSFFRQTCIAAVVLTARVVERRLVGLPQRVRCPVSL
jgi:hypothetical protein